MTATALERVPLNRKLLTSLQQRLGDRLSTSAAVCAQHGKDESYHAPPNKPLLPTALCAAADWHVVEQARTPAM